MNNANSRKLEIIEYSQVIFDIEEKYLLRLKEIKPSNNYISSREMFAKTSDGKKVAIDKAMKDKGFGAALKVWWTNQSMVAKIAWISFVVIIFLAAIFGDV
jgi:hypothetical protein